MATRVVDLGSVRGPQGDRGPGSNLNLLDNWHFADPINQRNKSGTVTAAGYFIDRWKLVSGSVTLTDNGLVLNGTISQVLETAPGGTVTASALTTAGLGTASYNAATKTFCVTATGQTVVAAKLELGSVQTLAVQSGSNWVLNDPPPNKALELARCQRYFIRIAGSANPVIFGAQNTIFGQLWIPLPLTMRVNPTYLIQADLLMGEDPPGGPHTGTAELSKIGVYIRRNDFNVTSGYYSGMVYFNTNSDYIDLSADL